MDIIFSPFWLRLQSGKFLMFEEALGEANQNHFRVIAALDFIRPENLIHDFYRGPGRPKIDRENFFRAFVAKKVLNIPTRNALIDRLKVDSVLAPSSPVVSVLDFLTNLYLHPICRMEGIRSGMGFRDSRARA